MINWCGPEEGTYSDIGTAAEEIHIGGCSREVAMGPPSQSSVVAILHWWTTEGVILIVKIRHFLIHE